MKGQEPEPLDIDADPRNADWLHRMPKVRIRERDTAMSSGMPANPGSGVGNVHVPTSLQKKKPAQTKKPTKKK